MDSDSRHLDSRRCICWHGAGPSCLLRTSPCFINVKYKQEAPLLMNTSHKDDNLHLGN